MKIRYLCYVDKTPFGPRYSYAVSDVERGIVFEIGFTASSVIREDMRPNEDARCVRDLWRHIKRESPGTFLDAKAMGFV